MLKMYRLFVFLFFCPLFNLLGQDIGLPTKVRKQFISIKSITDKKANNISEQIILPTDTLVYLKPINSKFELDYYCKCFEDEEIVNYSYGYAFTKKRKGYLNYRMTQWNAEIVVFIDKKIPKKVQKRFKSFVEPLSNLRNIKISFSKNPLESNYHIVASDKALKIYENENDSLDIRHALSGATYTLFSDNNDKYYSAKLKLDLNAVQDSDLILKKMKQLFFLSLGQFQISSISKTKGSILNLDYNNSDIISQKDLGVLKLHYFKIHDYPFSRKDFSDFYLKIESLCYK